MNEDIKTETYPNATVTMEKLPVSGVHVVQMRDITTDRIKTSLCDGYEAAMYVFAAYCTIAEDA